MNPARIYTLRVVANRPAFPLPDRSVVIRICKKGSYTFVELAELDSELIPIMSTRHRSVESAREHFEDLYGETA